MAFSFFLTSCPDLPDALVKMILLLPDDLEYLCLQPLGTICSELDASRFLLTLLQDFLELETWLETFVAC